MASLLEQILARAIATSLLSGEPLGKCFLAHVAYLLLFLSIPALILLYG